MMSDFAAEIVVTGEPVAVQFASVGRTCTPRPAPAYRSRSVSQQIQFVVRPSARLGTWTIAVACGKRTTRLRLKVAGDRLRRGKNLIARSLGSGTILAPRAGAAGWRPTTTVDQ